MTSRGTREATAGAGTTDAANPCRFDCTLAHLPSLFISSPNCFRSFCTAARFYLHFAPCLSFSVLSLSMVCSFLCITPTFDPHFSVFDPNFLSAFRAFQLCAPYNHQPQPTRIQTFVPGDPSTTHLYCRFVVAVDFSTLVSPIHRIIISTHPGHRPRPWPRA